MIKLFSFAGGMMFSLITLLIPGVSNAQHIPDSILKKQAGRIENPLQKLLQLTPKSYEFDRKNFSHLALQAGPRFGFFSEEVKAVFPGLVRDRPIKYLYGKNLYRNATISEVDQVALIPIMIGAIQQQQAEIEQLKEMIREMRKDFHSKNNSASSK